MEAKSLNNIPHNTKVQRRKSKKNLLLHLHPHRIPEANLNFMHTWGLGGMAVILVLLQIFTGILLRFHYVASPQDAYDSIIKIQEGLVFGRFVRNVHHWGAMILIIVTFLHLIRVFLTGAFLPPRHWNWIIGVALFLGVVFINFTGYLLPWDQLSYWAITVSTNMLDYVPAIGPGIKVLIRGGGDVGAPTLLNFYTFHTAIFPVALIILMFIHFWKVRKAGGVILSRKISTSDIPQIETSPHLINREIVTALCLLAFVFLFSTIFDAPLQEKANPAFSPNPAKSPWYFQGIQELILHFHPFFAVVVIPFILMAGIIAVPFLKYNAGVEKVDFSKKPFSKIILWSAVTGLIVTPVLILLDEYVFRLQEMIVNIPPVLSVGLLPFLVLAGLTWLFITVIKKRFSSKKTDVVLALFVLFVTAYLVLMFVGTFLRGEGMRLDF